MFKSKATRPQETLTQDATPPVLNQLPYSLKSYDDKAVRENGKRNLA